MLAFLKLIQKERLVTCALRARRARTPGRGAPPRAEAASPRGRPPCQHQVNTSPKVNKSLGVATLKPPKLTHLKSQHTFKVNQQSTPRLAKPPLSGGGHPVHTQVNTSPKVNTLQESTRPQKSTPRLAKLFLPGGGHPETTKVNTPQKSARFRVNKPPNVNTSRGEASSSRSFCESQFPHKSVNLFFIFFISRIIKFFPGAASLWAPKSMRLQSKQVSRIQQAFVNTQGPSWGI